MSTKQDAASEARAIEEPVAAKRAWGPVLRGEARARLARYDAAVKREADLCAADPTRPRGQLLLVVDREVFAAMLARLDALAPLEQAAARVQEADAECFAAQAAYDAADRACTASVWGDPGDAISAQAERARADARRMAAHHAGVDANRALRRALARGER